MVCTPKTQRNIAGGCAIFVGLLLIILGGALTVAFTQIFAATISSRITITGSRMQYGPVISTANGGPASEEDDNGQINDIYLADITNVAAVMTGAQPIVKELGPFTYRRYNTIDMNCFTCGISGGVQTYFSRSQWIYPVGTMPDANTYSSAQLDSTYVTVPNLAFRVLEATLVTYSGGLAKTFEDIAIPVFATSGLTGFKAALDSAMVVTTLPIALQAMFAVASSSSSSPAVEAAWMSGTSQARPLSLPTALAGAGFTGHAMTSATAARLWAPTSVTSFVGAAYAQWSAAFMAPPGSPAQSAAVAILVNAYEIDMVASGADSAMDGATALLHVSTILQWLGSFVQGNPTYTTYAKTAAAGALFSQGYLTTNSWTDVLPAQLASNSIMGALAAGGGAPASVVSGLGGDNSCPSGTALSDSAAFAAQLPGATTSDKLLEMSCWGSRVNPNYLGTKLTSTAMSTFLDAITAGAPAIAGLPAGSQASATFLGGAGGLASFLARVAADPSVATLDPATVVGFAAVKTAWVTYKAAPTSGNLAAYASVLAAQPNCTTTYNPLLFSISCAAILDIAAWLNHIARDMVWTPTFVAKPPGFINFNTGVWTPHTEPFFATLANEANPMRAGPFLRCTLREALELGCHDNAVNAISALFGLAVNGGASARHPPAGVSSYEGSTMDSAWAAYKAAKLPDSRYTGETDVKLTDTILKDAGQSVVSTFGGPMGSAETTNPVAGSYSGVQFPPTLNLDTVLTNPPASVPVWIYQGRRTVTLEVDPHSVMGMTKDPTDTLPVWKYRLATTSNGSNTAWERAIPRMKTDLVATTPSCAANVAALASGAAVYISKPYFTGCPPDALNNGPIPGYAYHPSDTKDRNDANYGTYVSVEPITGKTVDARKRLGAHLRWTASAWYPMRTTYGLVYWACIRATILPSQAKALNDIFNTTRMLIKVNFPGAMCGIGMFILLIGIFCVRSAQAMDAEARAKLAASEGAKGVTDEPTTATNPMAPASSSTAV